MARPALNGILYTLKRGVERCQVVQLVVQKLVTPSRGVLFFACQTCGPINLPDASSRSLAVLKKSNGRNSVRKAAFFAPIADYESPSNEEQLSVFKRIDRRSTYGAKLH